MTIAGDFNPNAFVLSYVVDTCAVWNLLSSGRLRRAAVSAGVTACITDYVRYECLIKPRKKRTSEDDELVARALAAIATGEITVHSLDIEDLQDLEVLRSRRRLGRGELASIVFAKKVNIGVMSDDRKASRLAHDVLGHVSRSSTTPRLLGWLLFWGHLDPGDVDLVVRQHGEVGRPLEKHFRAMVGLVAAYRRVAEGTEPG